MYYASSSENQEITALWFGDTSTAWVVSYLWLQMAAKNEQADITPPPCSPNRSRPKTASESPETFRPGAE